MDTAAKRKRELMWSGFFITATTQYKVESFWIYRRISFLWDISTFSFPFKCLSEYQYKYFYVGLLQNIFFSNWSLRWNIKFNVSNSFFSIWVLFHQHSSITGLQSKSKGIPLTPHYDFHPLYRHLDISRAITAE